LNRRSPRSAEPEPKPTPPEMVRVVDLRVTIDRPRPSPGSDDVIHWSDGEVLVALQDRQKWLEERLDAAVKDRLGPGFEVHTLEISPGSVELLITIFGALGAYSAARSGLDYLVADVQRILGHEVARDIGVTPYLDVWVVRPEGLVEQATEPAPSDGRDTVALWLIGAGAFMTTTLGLIGATGANLERVRINYPVQVSIAFGAVIFAILVGVCWPLLRGGTRIGARTAWVIVAVLTGALVTFVADPSLESPLASITGGLLVAAFIGVLSWPLVRDAEQGKMSLLLPCVLLVGVAIGLIAYWSTRSLSAKTRPQITAQLVRAAATAKITGEVRATGLQRREHMLVRVIGVNSRGDLADTHVGHARAKEGTSHGQLVYGSRTGADQDGGVDVKLDVPVAAGLYDRFDIEAEFVDDEQHSASIREQTASAADASQVPRSGVPVKTRCGGTTRVVGCLSIFVPPVGEGARLTAAWKLPASKPPVLAINARMGDLSSDDRVLLSVRRLKRKGKKQGGRVYGALWAPSAAGRVNQKLRLAVDPTHRPLCVIMRSLQGALNYASREAEHLGPCGKRSRGVAILVRPPAS
jgi:hypothetical protein